MTITPKFAENFFAALATCKRDQIAPFVPDDADWLIVGPIELFPYCGQHIGREAVLAAYDKIGQRIEIRSRVTEFLVTGQDCASALTRFTLLSHESGREISVRVAQFARFRYAGAHEFCSITDTLGAAEQMFGHTLVASPALVA
jgi:hypothetical protein